MAGRNNKGMRVVRLNTTLFPVKPFEEDLYCRYGLDPHRCEANTPDELITQLADCDALLSSPQHFRGRSSSR